MSEEPVTKPGRLRMPPLLDSALGTRVGRNVIANYAGSLVNAVSPLLALPFLVQALGQAMWGLVAFVVLMTTLLRVVNAGLAQSMVREFGVRWSGGDTGRLAAARLLFSYERIYWFVAMLMALCVLPFAELIVSRWLHIGGISQNVAVTAIYCALALFFVQLPSAIYRTVLSGLQAQIWMNTAQGAFALIKAIGGVGVAMWSGSVIAYLVFIVLVSSMETLTNAIGAWRLMPEARSRVRWDAFEVRSTFRFSLAMSFLAGVGMLTTQVDKFYVSLKLPIEQLGIYSIAYSLAMGALQIGYPIFTALLPRLVEIGSDHALRYRANIRLLKSLILIIFLVGGLYLAFGRLFLSLWLGDETLAPQVARILDWLLIASALNTIYNIGYINWVSEANLRWLSAINLVSLALALVFTPMAIDMFGLVGAAVALLTVNMLGAVATLVWITQNSRKMKQNP